MNIHLCKIEPIYIQKRYVTKYLSDTFEKDTKLQYKDKKKMF